MLGTEVLRQLQNLKGIGKGSIKAVFQGMGDEERLNPGEGCSFQGIQPKRERVFSRSPLTCREISHLSLILKWKLQGLTSLLILPCSAREKSSAKWKFPGKLSIMKPASSLFLQCYKTLWTTMKRGGNTTQRQHRELRIQSGAEVRDCLFPFTATPVLP